MSINQKDIFESSFPNYNDENKLNIQKNYTQKRINKYPILVPSEENYYNNSVNKKNNKKEERKDNKRSFNLNYINNNKKDIYYLNTENDIEKNTTRKLHTDNQELSGESLRNSENIGLKENKSIKNKNENIEEKDEVEPHIENEKLEKIKNEYDKYTINENKEEGSKSNIVNSLYPNKCVIILRIILYNFIRPIYLFLFIVAILLCIPTYSDLPIIISIIIYLIMICTSIIIEIIEEIKGQNRNIFYTENTKYCKITDNKLLNILGKNIQKGDILVVKKDEVCPCDMIIIDSSINSIPLFFQSEYLTGTFNFNIRLIKKNLLAKFENVKKKFEPKFLEFIKNLQEEEIQRMIEEQKKIRKSELIYKDFLERNGLVNAREEEKKKEEEKQKRLMELRYDPNNTIYEELKNKEYYKTISENIFKGYYYLPKNSKKKLYYLNLLFDNEDNEILEITYKNMCYCGEKVKNAMWVIGIAVHTGEEVKSIKDINKEFNSFSTYYQKRKTVFEKEINYYFFILLTILIFLSIIAGIINMIYVNFFDDILHNKTDKNRHPTSPVKNFYHSFLDYFCLMHSIIPYTIFFTIEIVLLFQKLYINSDIDLFNKNKEILTNSKQIEDLGKIDLILTDKTGTLTKNERYFKYCVIADGCYEYRKDGKKSSLNIISKDYKKNLTFSDYDMINSSSYRKGNGIIDSVQYDGYIVRSEQKFNECIYLDRTEKLIEEFWKALALCHDALPVFKKSNLYGEYYLEEENKNEQKYFSNSADNTTLVEMASKQGFTFFMDEKNASLYMGDGTSDKENNQFYNLTNCDCEIILGEPGPDFEKITLPVKKLCHLKFHSQRKRESVIVREGNYIKLYVKGPRDDILPRVIEDYTPKKLIYNAKNWLSKVEGMGCRAFVVGMRILTLEEYNVFISCFKEAHNDEFDTKIRISKVIDSLESNLTLLGGAFIEDLLPKRIEDAVANIKNAGIKIWMVTGDKVSNSYNVGISTGIIDKNNEIILAEINQEVLLEKQNKEQNAKNNLLNNINKRLKNIENEKNDKENEEIKENKEELAENEEKNKHIENQLKGVLKSFNDEFKKMQKKSSLLNYTNKYDIVIDSLSFREISKTPQDIKSFFDKAILANSLTFCGFHSNDKRMLVKSIRDYIKGIKNINSYTIMGVGDGFNDIEMLREVDIGVGINNGINKSTKINIDNFADISRLIMFHGINNLKRNSEIIKLLIVRHFMLGFIFFLYGCHCFFTNVYIIPTQDIYLCLFILNLFGPFLKGIFDINVFYFYDKKEKIEKENENEIKSNNSKDSNKENENKNKDKNNEYIIEQNEIKERIKNRMFKNIFDSSFKYIYLQKNIDLIESGSEHIPYKKYISVNSFIFLIIKSILFCIINFYLTYGSVDSGHNIIDLKGDLIDFRSLQIILWSNHCFIIFLENEIFTSFYTIFRIVEIVLFVVIYLIIFILYQKQNTKLTNPLNSFLLFLNFLLVVSFCSFVNFGIYIIQNLFDNTVIYKLRNMKTDEKYLEEMKILVKYKEEIDMEEKEEDEEFPKIVENQNVNLLEIIDESEDKSNNDFEKNVLNNNNDILFNIGNNISAIKNENDYNYANNNFNDYYIYQSQNFNNSKVIVNRKNKGLSKSQNINNFKDLDYFNKNLIKKREIKKSELQDSINLINTNRIKAKQKDNESKTHLKYVKENYK